MKSNLSKEIVDTHFHVFSAGDGLQAARYKPLYDASLGAWQQAGGRVGVRRGVLVQTSFMGADNARLLHELKSEPDRLRGIAVVSSDVDTAQFAHWHAIGVRGIRLNLAGVSHEIPDWSCADLVWSAMQELGWHLEIHTDIGGLPRVLQQLPSDIPLVLDHMAKPDRIAVDDPTVQCVLQRIGKTPVHVKLSGAYRLAGRAADQIAGMWSDLLGVQQLLWGSDWPCTNHEAEADYSKLFQQLESWVGEESIEKVLVHNPFALYWKK